MWTHHKTALSPQYGHQYQFFRDEQGLTYAEVLRLWQADEGFRQYFIQLIRDSGLQASFWETPPISVETLERPFEMVLGPSPGLLRVQPEAATFADQFRSHPAHETVLSFANLGGDAELIVPRPLQPTDDYAHLMRFLHNAPPAQVHALWQEVGQRAEALLSPRPRWISTAGMGVYWLHVRIDTRPKYYRYEPYKRDQDTLLY